MTRKKVVEKVKQYWPHAKPLEIMNVLDHYGKESGERGRARVQLAILKVSEGKRERLEDLVRSAKRDFRDVLAYAEYPEEMKLGFAEKKQLSADEVNAIRKRDRAQYLEWLGG